jgi:hypothetical protein
MSASWEASQPDRYPCACDGRPHWHPRPRVTAYRYAADHGLPCDLDSLLALGLAAARRGRWLGIGEYRVLEGPLWVHTWPAAVFDLVVRSWQAVAGAMEIYARLPADDVFGYVPDAGLPRDAGWGEDGVPWDGDDIRYGGYGPHSDPGYEPEVIPPWCPLPQGDQALRDTGF